MTVEASEAFEQIGDLHSALDTVALLIVSRELTADHVADLETMMKRTGQAVRDVVEHPVIGDPDPELAAGTSALLRAVRDTEVAARQKRGATGVSRGLSPEREKPRSL
ncbi:hypothetical protein ACOBQX_18085 [Actinokineospora sp. G85]|uniref:hypothetical protein n=1 Tax=Actinokineospora sp. G85 TaxID=3406626 RepID=UPI003C7657CB